MKFSGLFKKQTEIPKISESQFKDNLQKLWQRTHPEVFTASKAREVSNRTNSFLYLEKNVLSVILYNVQCAAERHQNKVDGKIEGTTFSKEEVDYCTKYLKMAGYGVCLVANNDKGNMEYHLNW